MVDQAFALERIEELVDAELWCPRQRQEWTAMLTVMVWAMDWKTGLVVGVTRERLAAVSGRSTRSVSRIWRWAEDAGLMVRVEEGASGKWLGTQQNRAATFAVVAAVGAAAARRVITRDAENAQLNPAGDNNGKPPVSYVENKPLRRLTRSATTPSTARWLSHRIPETPAQHRAAASELLYRAGLDEKGLSAKRLHGLLLSWWDHGASPAGLMHMLDHHPDRPEVRRGPAFLGGRDPLALMGYRLAPWVGRLAELPSAVRGVRGDYLTAQKARLDALLDASIVARSQRLHADGQTSPRAGRSGGLPRQTSRKRMTRAELFATANQERELDPYARALARARNECRSAREGLSR